MLFHNNILEQYLRILCKLVISDMELISASAEPCPDALSNIDGHAIKGHEDIFRQSLLHRLIV